MRNILHAFSIFYSIKTIEVPKLWMYKSKLENIKTDLEYGDFV